MADMVPMDPTDDEVIRGALASARVIAVVGWSANPERPSHYVAEFLRAKGKVIVPVNPGLAGQVIDGLRVYGDLAEIPAEVAVDMVDVFRRSPDVPPVVASALQSLPGLRTIWMQLGIAHPEAAATARARGITVVENRCPMIEYPRLIG